MILQTKLKRTYSILQCLLLGNKYKSWCRRMVHDSAPLVGILEYTLEEPRVICFSGVGGASTLVRSSFVFVE